MADLTDLQAAQTVKIVGSSSTSVETNPLQVTINGDAKIVNGLRQGGVYGNLNIPTVGVPVEVRVGASRLANRKFISISTTTINIWWGYDSSVTTATGTPLANNQFITFECDPDSTFQIWLVGSTANRTARITESA